MARRRLPWDLVMKKMEFHGISWFFWVNFTTKMGIMKQSRMGDWNDFTKQELRNQPKLPSSLAPKKNVNHPFWFHFPETHMEPLANW